MKTNELKRNIRDLAGCVAIYENAKSSNGEKETAIEKAVELEKAIKADGHTIDTQTFYGMNGIALYEQGIKALWFAAIPKSIKRGQKPRVVVYEYSDIACADLLDARISAEDVTIEELRSIEDTADERIQSASLLGSIYEGCASVRHELNEKELEAMKNKDYVIATENDHTNPDNSGAAVVIAEVHHEDITVKDDEPKEEKLDGIAELRFKPIPSPWDDVTITQKNETACIWVAGNTKPHANELKALGYKWSRKRKAWYLKPQAA